MEASQQQQQDEKFKVEDGKEKVSGKQLTIHDIEARLYELSNSKYVI